MSENHERPGGVDGPPIGKGFGGEGYDPGDPGFDPDDHFDPFGPFGPDFDSDDPDFDSEYRPDRPLPARRRGRRMIPLFVALAGICALAVFVTMVLSNGSSPAKPSGFVPSATDSAQAAGQVAQAFLSAWQAGDEQAAAQLTDDPTDALTALTAYRKDLNLHGLGTVVQSSDASGNVVFSVTATVGLPAALPGSASAAASAGSGGASAGGPNSGTASASAASASASASTSASPSVTGTWTYTSSLITSRVNGAQNWVVLWQPTILGANLTSTTHLQAVAVPPGAGMVLDDGSNNLADSADPGLQKIAGLLAATAPAGHGTPGIDVEVVDSADNPVPGIAPAVLTTPIVSGGLATTIDRKVENAAMAAVAMFPRSSMAVIQPTTGDILAIANNDEDNDDALTAQIAPGSTMKVITSTALLNLGMSTQSPVGCPKDYEVTGVDTQNSDGESEPDGTPFIDDFAASCNNAFTTQYLKLSDGVLSQTAQRYFGLTKPWDIGLGDPSTYFTMPTDAVNSELAAEAFGQGQLLASPLAMASVAATVQTGSFHQPILVPGTKQVGATPLPAETDSELQQMMRAVVTYSNGTAHGVGFGSGVYAKTGTADHGVAGTAANSWIIVYDPTEDIAIGCVVLGGDFGAQSAGPEAKAVINAL
jgi:Penicillin binding protein transpeptidase domain